MHALPTWALLLSTLFLGPSSTHQSPAIGDPDGDADEYWIYVGSQVGDEIHRIHFGPEGIRVEGTISLGTPADGNGGTRGLVISPDQRHLYVLTGEGQEEGRLWKYALPRSEGEAEQLADGPIRLGPLSTTIDISPDGSFLFSPNFNFYGDRVPSTLSVVFGPDLYEVERIELCTMPHGARVSPSGNHVYAVCMMDDQLVEVDALSMELSRRFSVSQGREGPLPAELERGGPGTGEPDAAGDPDAAGAPPPAGLRLPGTSSGMTCAPTWASPSQDGRWVWVACNGTDEIHEVELEGWRLRRTFRTGRGPYQLAPTPDGRHLVTTLRQGGAVEIFDLAEGFSVARISTSAPGAHGLAVSPDGQYAFVSVEGSEGGTGKLDVMDLERMERVAEVEVGSQASGIAIWKPESR
jgi:DNA-binding beta-propeller fold protein YncE